MDETRGELALQHLREELLAGCLVEDALRMGLDTGRQGHAHPAQYGSTLVTR
jgi:hypothetical protein